MGRERLRSNRNRIVEKNKQTDQPAAPAQGGKDRGMQRVTRYVISLGMESVKRAKAVPTSMSKTPQDLVPPRRKGRVRATMAGVDPPQRCQGKRWPKPHALTSNRASVVVVTSVFINTKMQLLPQRNSKRTNSPAPQKLRHALLKSMHVSQRGKGCQRLQKP